MRVRRSTIPSSPAKLNPSKRGREDGSGTVDAVPLISAKTPVGEGVVPPFATMKSNVLTPDVKPEVIENAVKDPKPANAVQSPVFTPLRKMHPLLSDAQDTDS